MTEETYKPLVMVVDDTPVNLRMLKDVLKEQDIAVRVFPRGDMALKAAVAVPPDLVLLDINMPDMDGFEVCRRLKKNRTLQDVPVIFISALTETADKMRAFSSGGVDYVTKPFQREEVLARVGVHLNLRRAQIEIHKKNKRLEAILSQLKAAQTQVVQSEKMASVGMLAAGVAHEINNPLNYINSSANTVGRIAESLPTLFEEYVTQLSGNAGDCAEPMVKQKREELYELLQELRELTSNITEGAKRSFEIVQGLRLFTRVDKRGLETANLQQGLESTLKLLSNRTKNSILVERQYSEIPAVDCYPGKLNQVFMNLLVNAVDALERSGNKQGRILLRTDSEERENGLWVSITVIDNGPGISADVLPHIFEPFYSTKPIGQGIGMGLSISQSIVLEHGGSLVAANEPGGGARFTVWLPVSRQAIAPEERA